MNCPACKTVVLVMSDRQGIEIDYCPQCRGVWLDRGELDKLIEKSVVTRQPSQNSGTEYVNHGNPEYGKYDDDYYKKQYGKKKNRGFMGDIFDFD